METRIKYAIKPTLPDERDPVEAAVWRRMYDVCQNLRLGVKEYFHICQSVTALFHEMIEDGVCSAPKDPEQ